MNIYGAMAPHYGARNTVIDRLTDKLGGKQCPWTQPLPTSTDIYVAWRLKMCPSYESMVKSGVCMVCIDLGYFDKTKFECFSVSVNGVHGEAMKVEGLQDLPERPKPELHPWRHDGNKIQIISTGFNKRMARKGIVATSYPKDWLETTRAAAQKAFGMEAYIRYHPRKLPEGEPVPPPFEETFEETFCSVTYSSTTAVQTMIAGVPTVVMHPRSPAYELASQELKATRPDGREAWLHELSHRNFDMCDPKEYDAAAEYIMRAYEQL